MKMTGMRAAVLNLGCKVNHYESEAIRQQLSEAGFDLVPFHEAADVYVINTCTVTGEAARKSRQMVRRARRNNADAVVVAVGCDVEMERDQLAADLTIGNRGKADVARHVLDFLQTARPGDAAGSGTAGSDRPDRLDIGAAGSDPTGREAFEELGAVIRQNDTRAIIKVQDGCNQFCSYCAIPYARGRVRSREPGAVLREAAGLAAAGFRELVITGIHVCSYGTDWAKPEDVDRPVPEPSDAHLPDRGTPEAASVQADPEPLMALCEQLAAIPGIRRIRLGSIEPKSVSEAFARRMGANPAMCPHVHLSLQSGSDATLKMMRRRYTAAEYRAAVERLRRFVPGVVLTTDVIVGFPGETHARHLDSLAFCRSIGFAKIHTFRYSPREGTLAARLDQTVSSACAEQRSRDFLALSDEGWASAAAAASGTKQQVLLEERTPDGLWTGYTPGYLPVYADLGDAARAGDLVMLRVTELQGGRLMAVPAAPV